MIEVNRILLKKIGVKDETVGRFERILEMTGHPPLDMLAAFIDEGVMEVIRIYSRNLKYKDRFPKFFPEFSAMGQSFAQLRAAADEITRGVVRPPESETEESEHEALDA